MANARAFVSNMDLRTYFAARAPKKPAAWFEPVVPPCPKEEYDHDHAKCEYCEAMPSNWQAISEWRGYREEATAVQWPWAWADAVLAAAEVPHAR